MAEKQDVKEIEASLKRMLNMGPVEPEQNISVVKQEPASVNREVKKQDETPVTESSNGKEINRMSHHHQSDPAIIGIEAKDDTQQESVAKKKPRKPKKKKNKPISVEEQAALDRLGQAAGQVKTEPEKKKSNGSQNMDSQTKAKGNERRKKSITQADSDEDDSDLQKLSPAHLKTAIKSRYLDNKLTPAIMNELEKHKIFPLKKKSSKFPSAKYFCRLCEYHCDNIPVCRQHYNEARHKRRAEVAVQDRMLKKLPQPSERHLSSLNQVLLGIYQQYGLSDQDLQHRKDIANSVQNFLNQSIADLELRVYGSSLTGFGLKTSDLNMDLAVPDGLNPAQLLTRVYKLLLSCDTYQNVKSNFLAKVPSVLFDSPCGTVHCEISVNSDLAYYTSRLLEIYSKVDPRVRQLAAIFRHWAKLCQVDDQNKGSLPAYSFGLMTVFYLQQCKPPLLPVLWQDLSEVVLKRPKTSNDILTMLYNLDLERQEWVCENTKSLGQLWIDLLLFYGVNYNISDHVITIRQERVLLRSEKKWKTRRIAIEDPFFNKRNVARTLFSVPIFDYLYNCLRKGCLYFSLPTNQTDIDLGNNKSNCRPKQPKELPKKLSNTQEVPYPSETDENLRTLAGSDVSSDISADVPRKPKDSLTVTEADSSNVEYALTISGSSSDFSIKENEFLADSKDMSNVESEAGSSIQEHSFLSSGEMTGEPSELNDGVTNSTVNSDNLETVIETDRLVLEQEKLVEMDKFKPDSVISQSENSISDADITGGKKLKENSCHEEEKTKDLLICDKGLLVGDAHIDICDDIVTEKGNVEMNTKAKLDAISEIGAANKISPSKKSESLKLDNVQEDTESMESNIMSVFTKEETDTDNVNESLTCNKGISVKELTVSDSENDTVRHIIPEHSFLNEEENNGGPVEGDDDNEKVDDVEDIIDHSFLTDDSVILHLMDSSQNIDSEEDTSPDNQTKRDKILCKTLEDLEKNDVNDAGELLESGSESDIELESPDSSPVRKRKFERPTSPEDAEYDFVFSVDSLTDGKGPSIFCGICEKEGHLKSNCPEEQLPEVKQLPPATKQHLKLLTNVIRTVPVDFKLSQRELDDREAVRRGLEDFIQELFPDAELSLFGSSKNGFGFHFSDLDICVTFRGKNPEDLNFVEVIEALSKKLKTHRSFYNVFPITTAKVPIVKFIHRPTRLEGDISLYNILAQQNTRLLYCYSCVDPRVITLGYGIKVFAKVCDIGDASKGSLSSYAYMLLLFHYLQHTQPPVIPVLQELKTGDEKSELMVDGWNAWFYDDLKNLQNVWPHYGRNNQSVGELWLGLFKYYCEEFNIEEQVVTIRQFEPLTKFEKLWNSKCIAIEDPFDLSHNLGAGLTRKMHKYIMTAFINARELYGTSVTEPPHGFNTLADYFFDRERLTEGDLPNDRLCRVCSKIGHIARECPRVLARKEREAEEKKRREEMRKAQELRDKGGTTPNRGNNQNKQKQQQKAHPGPSRSLSDPVDTSPRRPMGRSQMFINRQFSAGSNLQSYDNSQGYSQNPRHPAYSQSSPQPIPPQTYSRDQRPQSNSPRAYPQSNQSQSPRGFNPPVQSFSPRGYNQQAGNSFHWANQNDNSARHFNSPIQNFTNMQNFGANQNQNYIPPLMALPNQMQGNQFIKGNRAYRSSPNQKQGYQNRRQQPGSLLTNEEQDVSSPANRNPAYNRSQQHQQQQQVPGSKRQVTMTAGFNSLADVTVNNEYYQRKKEKK